MALHKILTLAALALAGTGGSYLYLHHDRGSAAAIAAMTQQSAATAPAAGSAAAAEDPPVLRSISGTYLASHYAQSRNDWKYAAPLLNALLENDPDNKELMRQAMILAEGSGDHDLAARRAQQVMEKNPADGLSHLIVATHAISQGQYDKAIAALSTLPKGDMSDFVLPLLQGWALAGKGEFRPEMFKATTIHAYHGALVAHYLKKDPSIVFAFAETILAPSGLTAEEVERAADLMAVSGHRKEALNVYKALQSRKGGSDLLAKKLAAAEKDGNVASLIPALGIKTPAQGAAIAILDLARILYQENSDASARVFAQMALDLDPDKEDAHILIASSYARSKQIDQAIAEFGKVPENSANYLSTQHEAAQLLSEAGRMPDAVALLTTLYAARHDPESLIRTGDLYRGKEDFKKALETYNAVAATLPAPLPQKYWYLLYARGMTQERLGHWPEAEADLKQALAYQPDHPYIMNYLGYAWIDQGIHMDEAMKMLEEASALRPNDGYITDSLGWAHYKMAQFAEAVPLLEQAVGIMPYDPEINSHLGDAYWQAGRRVEARFQWERARNYSKDAKLSEALAAKLDKGLPETPATKQAGTPASPAER